jgi:hypothetical protein
LSGASSGDTIVALRACLQSTRTVSYVTNGDLLASTLNEDQNYQTYLLSDRDTEQTRSFNLQKSAVGVDTEIASPVPNSYLRWNSAGTKLINQTDIVLYGEGETVKTDTIATFRIIQDTPEYVYVTGYHTANDGAFGSHFFRLATDTGQVDNGGTIIRTVNGVYELQYDGSVNVKWFGVVSTNTPSANALIFQSIIDAGITNINCGEHQFPLDSVEIKNSGTNIHGEGIDKTIIYSTGNLSSRGIFWCDSGSSSSFINSIKFTDITIDGKTDTLLFSEQQHIMSLSGISNSIFERVHFKAPRGDGLYLGSGVGTERHNKNITVRECIFDGVNNQNRNGISVVDCDGIFISNNKFINFTKSTMPGAIDFEPNSLFNVIKNIDVSHNNFYNIGGNVAVIGFVIQDLVYTTTPTNINVSNNFINDCIDTSRAVVYMFNKATEILDTDLDNNIKILDNICSNTSGSFFIKNAKGVIISGNSFYKSKNESYIGLSTGNKCINVLITNNYFKECGYLSGKGMVITSVKDLMIKDNIFDDCCNGVAGSNAINFNAGTSSFVDITGNIIKSPTSKTHIAIQKEAAHTLTPSTNKLFNNHFNGLSSIAFASEHNDSNQTVYTPIVTGSTTAGVGTYTFQHGVYNRVGNLVYFKAKISMSSHTGTGMIQIGLPVSAIPASSNAETSLSLALDGVASTGGHIGLMNPALSIDGKSGGVRCYKSQAGALGQITIPAGAFSIYVSGIYTASPSV